MHLNSRTKRREAEQRDARFKISDRLAAQTAEARLQHVRDRLAAETAKERPG